MGVETLPERYRKPRIAVFDDVMPVEWLGELGVFLDSQRRRFEVGGDGVGRFGYQLLDVDEEYPPLAKLKKELVERIADEATIEALDAPDFALSRIEAHATLYHHGGFFRSHVDEEEGGSRRVGFALFLHSGTRMFSGGEMEFLDGTRVEPENNRLVFYDPLQNHGVRRVECWSAKFLHGRWAVSGWLHG